MKRYLTVPVSLLLLLRVFAQPCNCGNNKDAEELNRLYNEKMKPGSGANLSEAEHNAELCAQCAILAVHVCLCNCSAFDGDRVTKMKEIQGNLDIINTWHNQHGKNIPIACQRVISYIPSSCAGSGQGTNSGTSTGLSSKDEENFVDLEQAVANGDNDKITEIKNKILELVKQKYPDKLEEIQKRISETIVRGKSKTDNKPAKNTYTAGWSYLKEYQKLLNDYITQCNHVANGGDPMQLLDLATKMSEWLTNNTSVFTQFTPEQTETLTKMTNYFSDAVMKCVTGMGSNLTNVYFADEAEQQNNFVPNIQTGAIKYTPGEKTTGTQPPSGNGDLGNGNGMFHNEDPHHDTGPNEGQKLKNP